MVLTGGGGKLEAILRILYRFFSQVTASNIRSIGQAVEFVTRCVCDCVKFFAGFAVRVPLAKTLD